MIFIEQVEILATPKKVFEFLARKHEFKQAKNSPVLLLEKSTEGEIGVGTRYEEHVKMFPGIIGKIYSEITVYEPGKALEEKFSGVGLVGTTRYTFQGKGNATILVHEQNMTFKGILSIFNVILRPIFGVAMRKRMVGIKEVLEATGKES